MPNVKNFVIAKIEVPVNVIEHFEALARFVFM
jgi:hypothetical protein